MERFFLSQTWNDLFILSATLIFFFPGFYANPGLQLPLVLFQCVLFTVQAFFFQKRTGYPFLKIPVRKDVAPSFLALGGLILLSVVTAWIFQIAGIPPLRPQGAPPLWGGSEILLLFLSPWREELFFRGLFLETLKEKRVGVFGAVTFQALIFAAAHKPGWTMIFPFSAGILLGVFAYKKPGSLLLLFFVHLAYNLLMAFIPSGLF